MTSILDDKLLSLRLARHPEFHVRLVEFLHSYRIVEQPALVVQARPAHGSASTGVDVDDGNLQNRFRTGVADTSTWWEGFRSMVATRRTFHGIASLPNRENPTWASEVHRDGHFIAGIWKFPELSIGPKTADVVADFYLSIFADFVHLIELTLDPHANQPRYDATWTLVGAEKLHYASRSIFHQFNVSAPPPHIPHLQWTISEATVGTQEWKRIADLMGQALAGAYSHPHPPAQ